MDAAPSTLSETENMADVNVQQTADSHIVVRRMAICVAASLVFIVLSLTFATSDLGAVH